jgi:hypothetical protein
MEASDDIAITRPHDGSMHMLFEKELHGGFKVEAQQRI